MNKPDPHIEKSIVTAEHEGEDTLSNLFKYFEDLYGIESLNGLTWAHAVNSEAEFTSALNNEQVMFIEADVGMSADGTPIMAHPPSTESDLTLESFLKRLKESKQGIKLDFKNWDAVKPGIQFLKDIGFKQPIILNADILQGNHAKPPAVPAQDFIDICMQHYPQGILSLGWTTEPDQPYTQGNVDEMIATVSSLPTVLFPIRASLVRASWEQLLRLIPSDKPGWALSFWNAKDEVPDDEFIRWLKNDAQPSRALYDLMDKDKSPIPVDI